jgi:hypothetical protein
MYSDGDRDDGQHNNNSNNSSSSSSDRSRGSDGRNDSSDNSDGGDRSDGGGSARGDLDGASDSSFLYDDEEDGRSDRTEDTALDPGDADGVADDVSGSDGNAGSDSEGDPEGGASPVIAWERAHLDSPICAPLFDGHQPWTRLEYMYFMLRMFDAHRGRGCRQLLESMMKLIATQLVPPGAPASATTSAVGVGARPAHLLLRTGCHF